MFKIALVEFSAWRFCRDIRKKTERDRHTDRKTDRQTHRQTDRQTDIRELWKHLVTPILEFGRTGINVKPIDSWVYQWCEVSMINLPMQPDLFKGLESWRNWLKHQTIGAR